MPANVTTLSLAEAKQRIDTVLHAYCDEQRRKAGRYDASYERLWRVIDEYLQGGGKRIRPYLVIMSYQAYGSEDIEAILPVAAAWELLHASLLVHDDIIDKDTLRHGKPNIAGVYQELYGEQLGDQAVHYAASAALLAGDLLLSGAHQLLLQADISAEHTLAAGDLLSDALFGVGGGELLDVEAVFQQPDSVLPEKIARFKTAEYSFEFPLACGAVLAGASKAQVSLLREFGRELGIAFQFADDLLGVFGTSKTTGKPVDSDIREQKRTLLVQEALARLDAPQAARMQELYQYGHVMDQSEINEVRALLEESGARQVVEQKAEHHIVQAVRMLEQLAIPPAHVAAFKSLADALVKRAA